MIVAPQCRRAALPVTRLQRRVSYYKAGVSGPDDQKVVSGSSNRIHNAADTDESGDRPRLKIDCVLSWILNDALIGPETKDTNCRLEICPGPSSRPVGSACLTAARNQRRISVRSVIVEDLCVSRVARLIGTEHGPKCENQPV